MIEFWVLYLFNIHINILWKWRKILSWTSSIVGNTWSKGAGKMIFNFTDWLSTIAQPWRGGTIKLELSLLARVPCWRWCFQTNFPCPLQPFLFVVYLWMVMAPPIGMFCWWKEGTIPTKWKVYSYVSHNRKGHASIH